MLMLEHDEDDRYITQAVFDENQYAVRIHFVENSNDLFAHLITCEKNYTPLPSLILLNHYATPLNALDIIRDLKSNLKFAHIPIVVVSGTMNREIVRRCYVMGASSFILKPSSAADVSRKIATFVKYWFETVELP
jgi:CheY-like chemotaxis protein